MASKYLLGDGQPHDRAVYFTNTESAYGGEYWGNVAEAYVFDTIADVAARMVKNPQLRCFVTEVNDVCLERIQRGANGDPEHVELFNKFNHVSYVLNSR